MLACLVVKNFACDGGRVQDSSYILSGHIVMSRGLAAPAQRITLSLCMHERILRCKARISRA